MFYNLEHSELKNKKPDYLVEAKIVPDGFKNVLHKKCLRQAEILTE